MAALANCVHVCVIWRIDKNWQSLLPESVLQWGIAWLWCPVAVPCRVPSPTPPYCTLRGVTGQHAVSFLTSQIPHTEGPLNTSEAAHEFPLPGLAYA